MVDINILLEGEQLSLMRAREAHGTDDGRRHLADAMIFAERLKASAYPHRRFAPAWLP